MSRRQIVIYDNQSGLVLKSLFGGLITKRTQILKYVNSIPLSRIAFYYEHDDVNVIPGSDRVIKLFQGHTPILCDSRGVSKSVYNLIQKRQLAISKASVLKVDLRFGMGDQVTGLEALLAFSKLYPEKKIIAGIHPVFKNVVNYLTPHPILSDQGNSDLPQNSFYVNLNREIMLWDPRGGLHGLACLYGTELGIEEVQESVSLSIPFPIQQEWALKAGVNLLEKKRPLLGIHIHCNSRSTASWNLTPAMQLASLWHDATNGDVFAIGDPSNFILGDPLIFTTIWPCDWLSTASILQSLDLLVCVDSGPMHLGRSAKINQLIIWGGSGPADILGRHPTQFDIRAEIDCIDNICAGCPKGTNDCINLISSDIVWDRIQSLFPHLLKSIPFKKEIPWKTTYGTSSIIAAK